MWCRRNETFTSIRSMQTSLKCLAGKVLSHAPSQWDVRDRYIQNGGLKKEDGVATVEVWVLVVMCVCVCEQVRSSVCVCVHSETLLASDKSSVPNPACTCAICCARWSQTQNTSERVRKHPRGRSGERADSWAGRWWHCLTMWLKLGLKLFQSESLIPACL